MQLYKSPGGIQSSNFHNELADINFPNKGFSLKGRKDSLPVISEQ